jgi:O-antigen/teichoic acid export membrane protein
VTPADPPTSDRPTTGNAAPRASVASGLAWNTIYQVFNTLLSFAAMLFMVRLLSPREYGRAASAVALISVANAFGSPSFVAHALQLGEEETPDWTLHWNVSMPLQLALFILLNTVALGCWFSTAYRPIAGLLAVGSIGVLLEWPAQIAGFSLRRELDFRRLRILQGVSGAVNAIAMIAIAAAGGGAYALIIANYVLPAAGLAIDLLIVRKWRPGNAWWSVPDLGSYRDAAKFGLQNLGSSLLARARSALEGVMLPVAAGFTQIGVMNRGSALHGLTVARVEGIILETVYPLLPRAATDDERFHRIAITYAQTILLTATCGTVFIGMMGPSLSRVLYGARWVAADPYIWPAALLGLGITTGSLGVNLLLARGRLRATLLLNAFGAALALPMIIIAMVRHSLIPYTWALAAAQGVCAIVALGIAGTYLPRTWKRDLLLPPVVSASSAAALLYLCIPVLMHWPPIIRVIAAGAIYTTAAAIVARVLFPDVAHNLVRHVPGSAHVSRLLRLGTRA